MELILKTVTTNDNERFAKAVAIARFDCLRLRRWLVSSVWEEISKERIIRKIWNENNKTKQSKINIKESANQF